MSEDRSSDQSALAGAAIREHFETFQGLVDRAKRFLGQSRLVEAAAYAQMAAFFASYEHAGIFASARCEGLLLEVHQNIARGWRAAPARGGHPERVLHVLTQAHGLGGHTRFAWRWIARDYGRAHSVALTRQGAAEVPAALCEAVHRSGGSIALLDSHRQSLVARARALFDQACDADIVVLHVHPHDVLPILAFGTSELCRPTVFLNHADHIFWLGVSVASVVANIRRSGEALALARRGVPPDACALLPIPVDLPVRAMPRAQAKVAIGVPEGATLLVSVAAAHKYGSGDHEAFLSLVTKLRQEAPSAHVCVVGPNEDEGWRRARERSGGRIRAVGSRSDVIRFYEAADIYIDSYPWGSLTSLIEAMSCGTPALAYAPDGADASVLSSDLPGTPSELFRVGTLDEYHSRLARLIHDQAYRKAVGEELAACVASAHGPERWKTFIEPVYALARSRRPSALVGPDAPQTTRLDALLEESAHRLVGHDTEVVAVQQSMRLLPAGSRLVAWAELAVRHQALDPRFVVSEESINIAKSILQWIKARQQR